MQVDQLDDRVQLVGYNTDSYAFGETIRHQFMFRRTGVLVLGTGGASRAVCHALEQLKAGYILVSRKRSDKTISYQEINQRILEKYAIIVNCTPLGMFPETDQAPPFPYPLLGPENLCYDLIYNPSKTLFLRRAEKQGAAIMNGLLMLYLQAMKSWEIWKKEAQE